MSLGVGDRLPEITLLDPSGTPTSVSAFSREDALLIFLRHLS